MKRKKNLLRSWSS